MASLNDLLVWVYIESSWKRDGGAKLDERTLALHNNVIDTLEDAFPELTANIVLSIENHTPYVRQCLDRIFEPRATSH